MISDSGNPPLRLNREQRQAAGHKDGPCLVLAGPGSGKTAVITARARTLIETHGIDPARILTVTFTKAAATEMAGRFHKMTDARYPSIAFGTFHAFFYRILKDAKGAGEPVPRFMKHPDKTRLAEEALRQCSMHYTGENSAALLSAFALVKNGNRPETAARTLPFADETRFRDLYGVYEEIRNSLNLMDFDDIARDTLAMLKTRPGLLETWQTRFSHFQVDEYQDINPVQLALIRLLSKPRNNLFVVGDDDQAIYGFRGASPDVMMRFESDYPGAARIHLRVNYRSEPEIMEAAASVIRRNQKRFEKEPLPARKVKETDLTADSVPADADGKPQIPATTEPVRAVQMHAYESGSAEAEAIAKQLQAGLAAYGTDLSDTAVIVRTNAEAGTFAAAFRKCGIPCFVKEAPSCLYDDPCAKDVEAYLRFACHGQRRADFLRIMNKPLRYLARNRVRAETVTRELLMREYADSPHMTERVTVFFRDCDMLRRLKPKLAVGYVRNAVGYERYLKQETGAGTCAQAKSVLDRMTEEAASFQLTADFLAHMEHTRNCLRDAGREAGQNRRGVRLLTMHAAKGLEFDTVFLPSLNEGVIPSVRAVTQDALEEERRLLYVAMTRARRQLLLSYVTGGTDGTRHRLPSPFLCHLKEGWIYQPRHDTIPEWLPVMHRTNHINRRPSIRHTAKGKTYGAKKFTDHAGI